MPIVRFVFLPKLRAGSFLVAYLFFNLLLMFAMGTLRIIGPSVSIGKIKTLLAKIVVQEVRALGWGDVVVAHAYVRIHLSIRASHVC